MSKIKLKLLADNIAVQKSEESENKSGIILPSTAKKEERPKEGIVKFVGPGTKEKPMTVKPGDHVVYGGWSDVTEIENEEFYFISVDDVKAIIE